MHCSNEVLGCGKNDCKCPCCLCVETKKAEKTHACGQDGGFEPDSGDSCPVCEEIRKRFGAGFGGH